MQWGNDLPSLTPNRASSQAATRYCERIRRLMKAIGPSPIAIDRYLNNLCFSHSNHPGIWVASVVCFRFQTKFLWLLGWIKIGTSFSPYEHITMAFVYQVAVDNFIFALPSHCLVKQILHNHSGICCDNGWIFICITSSPANCSFWWWRLQLTCNVSGQFTPLPGCGDHQGPICDLQFLLLWSIFLSSKVDVLGSFSRASIRGP